MSLVEQVSESSIVTILKAVIDLVVNLYEKIIFYLDVTGRHGKIMEISSATKLRYSNMGMIVNIMVWDERLPNDHDFQNVVELLSEPMGNGGRFRGVVFTGSGWFINTRSKLGRGNWRGTGDCYMNGINNLAFNANE